MNVSVAAITGLYSLIMSGLAETIILVRMTLFLSLVQISKLRHLTHWGRFASFTFVIRNAYVTGKKEGKKTQGAEVTR